MSALRTSAFAVALSSLAVPVSAQDDKPTAIPTNPAGFCEMLGDYQRAADGTAIRNAEGKPILSTVDASEACPDESVQAYIERLEPHYDTSLVCANRPEWCKGIDL